MAVLDLDDDTAVEHTVLLCVVGSDGLRGSGGESADPALVDAIVLKASGHGLSSLHAYAQVGLDGADIASVASDGDGEVGIVIEDFGDAGDGQSRLAEERATADVEADAAGMVNERLDVDVDFAHHGIGVLACLGLSKHGLAKLGLGND